MKHGWEESKNAGEIASATVQERELAQLESRVEKLEVLVVSFARQFARAKWSPQEPYNYSGLIQERIDAVMIYEKVAQHWAESSRQRARNLIDKTIASHRYLVDTLAKQCELLAHEIQKIDLPFGKTSVYGNSQKTGKVLDLKG